MIAGIYDTYQLASKLTPVKVRNIFYVWLSYHYSRITKKTRHFGMPVSMNIEPTTACNLGCPECPSGLKAFTRATGKIDLDLFEKTIKEMRKDTLYLNFYFQGEPFIHPDFLKMVKAASENGYYTATSSNAHFLNDEKAKATVQSGLNRLIISIDGTTQEVYEQYRKNGSLDKVLEGTENILKWKKELKSKTPQVIFQFLVVKPNEHQIEEVKKLGKKLGVDAVKFKTAQIYDFENGSPLMPTIEKYSRYKKKADGTYEIKNKLDNHCWKLWQSCVITWDGKVLPCCFDKDAQYVMGNVQNDSFKKIWNDSKYLNFRKSVLHSRADIDMCKNCSEGTKVWA